METIDVRVGCECECVGQGQRVSSVIQTGFRPGGGLPRQWWSCCDRLLCAVLGAGWLIVGGRGLDEPVRAPPETRQSCLTVRPPNYVKRRRSPRRTCIVPKHVVGTRPRRARGHVDRSTGPTRRARSRAPPWTDGVSIVIWGSHGRKINAYI